MDDIEYDLNNRPKEYTIHQTQYTPQPFIYDDDITYVPKLLPPSDPIMNLTIINTQITKGEEAEEDIMENT